MTEVQKIFGTDEAAKTGFQAIVVVEGDLASMDIEESKFKDKSSFANPYVTQARFTLENAEVLEVLPGEVAPDLKEDKFTFWYGYTKAGQTKASEKAPISVIFFKSFEILYGKGKFAQALENKKRVRVRYGDWPLGYKKVDPETQEEKPVTAKGFAFIAMDDAPEDVAAYLKKALVGMNATAAKRFLVMDAKAKKKPEYKELLKAGTLADELGLVVKKGVFAEKGAK